MICGLSLLPQNLAEFMFKTQLNRNGNSAENYLKIKFISEQYFPSRSGITANPPTFTNINVTQMMTNFLVVGKITQKEKTAMISICFFRLLLSG